MSRNRLFVSTTLAALLCLVAIPVHGLTNHSGDINANETWYASHNPHVVTGDVRVFAATGCCTLTVMPGVYVKFEAATVLQIGTTTQQGALMAVGKADTTISFSSNATTPAPGDWQGIHFQNQGRGKMDRCLVKEAGQGSLNAEITCAPGSGPTIQNCTIQESAGYGLILDDGAAPVLTANTFQDNAEYPVQVYGNYVPLVDTSNTLTGKGTNAIEVLGDEITDSATWPAHPIPYVIAGDLVVSKATAGDTLTLEPGTILQFKPQVTLQIGGGDPGVLIADGGAANIIFTMADTNKAYHWSGLYFSAKGSGFMDSCLVAYGGAGARMANIYCAMSSDPVIQNCTIQTSQHYGIVCADGALPTITGNTFQHNGQYPIRIYANYVPAIGQGNTAQDNGTDAIEVLGDNITSSVTWIDAQMPYAIAGDVVVFSPAIGDTLTLEPGVTLSFNPEVELQLGKDGHPGTLLALGKPDSAITFTSSAEKASPGDWAGIFCDSLGTGILDSCIVEYGGYGTHDANIYVVPGGSATLTQCTIRQSDGAGIKCWAAGATAQVTGCLITANQIGFLGNEATLLVHYSHIYDNLVYGGQNGTIADTIDATGNWWGDPTGPRDTSLGPPSYNPNGLGDRVTDYVAYDPWWDATLPGLSTLILSDPSPTAADSVVFTITFSRKMDPTVDPLVTFGLTSPFDSLAVVADTGWAADSLSWTGSFVITDSTGDGLNTIAVSGARDIWGWTMETDTAYTFFIDTQPPGSQASSPAISPADTFLVSWTVDDPLPSSGIAGVTVYVSENDSDWVAWLADATDTCALYPGQDEHTYYFYTVATDSAGNAEDTAAAAECTTYVDASAPLVPAMLLPADGAVVADTLPVFTWSPVTKAGGKTTTGRMNRRGTETEGTPVEYHLQCAVDDQFDSLLVDQESLTDTSYTPDAFNDGLYYWRVAASDGAGHHSGFPAAPFSFQVDTQPPVITGTTVWPDTSFPGPFPVTADITDESNIALVLLWYRTSLDTVPQADTMEVAGKGVYTGQIPELVESGLIQVEYYIDAHDAASPANIGTDPPNAPEDSIYSFWATVVSVEEGLSGEVPKTFALDQNYPNPFNAQTTIGYRIPARSAEGQTGVKLAIYNVRGQLVRILTDGQQAPGKYTVTWDGRDEGGFAVSSGIYFYQLAADQFCEVRKMLFLK